MYKDKSLLVTEDTRIVKEELGGLGGLFVKPLIGWICIRTQAHLVSSIESTGGAMREKDLVKHMCGLDRVDGPIRGALAIARDWPTDGTDFHKTTQLNDYLIQRGQPGVPPEALPPLPRPSSSAASASGASAHFSSPSYSAWQPAAPTIKNEEQEQDRKPAAAASSAAAATAASVEEGKGEGKCEVLTRMRLLEEVEQEKGGEEFAREHEEELRLAQEFEEEGGGYESEEKEDRGKGKGKGKRTKVVG